MVAIATAVSPSRSRARRLMRRGNDAGATASAQNRDSLSGLGATLTAYEQGVHVADGSVPRAATCAAASSSP